MTDSINVAFQYAPKEKQTIALCSDPQSVCDSTYGLSVGRGSFNFAAGAWTHVRQTVSLNTPGQQDGTFVLEVNGRQAFNRTDIFYRDTASSGDAHGDGSQNAGPNPPNVHARPSPSDGLLGPLLGGVIRRLHPLDRQYNIEDDLPPLFPPATASDQLPTTDAAAAALIAANAAPTQSVTNGETGTAAVVMITTGPGSTAETLATTTSSIIYSTETPPSFSLAQDSSQPKLVGFIGLFFRYVVFDFVLDYDD